MKHLKTLVLATAILIGSTSIMNAQSKVAHINTQELVASMPETKTAQAEIEKLGKTYEVEIQNMVTEYQNKIKLYEAEAPSKTEEVNAQRGQEVQSMNQSIGQYRSQAQQNMQKKEAELLQPIYKKVNDAIQAVAKAQGFNYVLDSMAGQGVLYADGKDLLADVKTQLGM